MRFVVFALALAGCYSPDVGPCRVQCTGDEPCPNDLVCNADGFCHAAGDDSTCPPPQFAVTVQPSGVGDNKIVGPNLMCPDVACTAMVERGTHVFSAQPGVDSRLVEWRIDGIAVTECGAQETCSIAVDSDMVVEAAFDVGKTLTLTFAGSSGTGTVTVVSDDPNLGTFECASTAGDCTVRYPPGTLARLTQKADIPGDPGPTWTGACTNPSAQSCVVMLDDNKTVGLEFEVITITLLPFPADGGAISLLGHSCSGNSTLPDDCEFQIGPSDGAGTTTLLAAPASTFRFDRWITTPSIGCDSAGALCTAGPITADTLIIAVFDENVTLTLFVGNGRIEMVVGGNLFVCGPNPLAGLCTFKLVRGQTVQLTATTPGNMGTFDHWIGCPSQSDPGLVSPCTFAMTADTSVSAFYKFDVNVVVDSQGSVSVSPDGDVCGPSQGPAITCPFEFVEGTVVSLLATPQPTKIFSTWNTTCPTNPQTANPCTFVVNRNAVVQPKWLSAGQ